MSNGNYWDGAIEQMPAGELRELQLERLKELVRYVYRENAGHRKRFADAGVKPQDIKKLEDIVKLPFLTKDDLRHYYPYGLACAPMPEILYVHASSGTTGKPVVAPYTKVDLDNWADLMARSMWAGGFRQDDILHNAYGYGLFTGAHGHDLGTQLDALGPAYWGAQPMVGHGEEEPRASPFPRDSARQEARGDRRGAVDSLPGLR